MLLTLQFKHFLPLDLQALCICGGINSATTLLAPSGNFDWRRQGKSKWLKCGTQKLNVLESADGSWSLLCRLIFLFLFFGMLRNVWIYMLNL